MTSEFTIKKEPTQWEAKLFSEDDEEVAEIEKRGGYQSEFRLLSKKRITSNGYSLTKLMVNTAILFLYKGSRKQERQEKGALLTVRDNIFKHNGKFYMLANHPEGKSWHNYANSPIRYISRLDNFPYSDVTEKDEKKRDQNLRQNLKRFGEFLSAKHRE